MAEKLVLWSAFCPWCNKFKQFTLEEATGVYRCDCCSDDYRRYPLGCWNCEREFPAWLDDKFCSRNCAKEYGYDGELEQCGCHGRL